MQNDPKIRNGFSDWIYMQLLRAYPRGFRALFADEMTETFRHLRAKTRKLGGKRAVLHLWLRVSWDTVYMGLAERWRRREPSRFNNPVPFVLNDFRYGMRTLRKNPGYAAAAVFTLALGIGATTTVFSQVNGLLIRPLPYAEPERLVQLSETAPGISSMDLSYPDFFYWQLHTEVFESMAAFDDARFALALDGRSERVEGAIVSTSVFSTLGVQPVVGRAFLPGEGQPDANPVAVISHGFWLELLGSSTDVIGTTLTLNGRSHTVVGVAPPNFMFPERARIWVPIRLDPLTADPTEYDWDAVARLKAGHTLEHALAEADAIARQLASTSPDTKAHIGAIAYPLRDADVNADVRLAYGVLLASVLFVLLIACVNVANLVLARGTSRRQELAMRSALGANRTRIVVQLLAESALLAFFGGLLGLLLSVWANGAIRLALPEELPFWIDFGIDRVVLTFVLLVSVATTVIFGLMPAMESSDDSGESLLQSNARGTVSSTHRRRISSILLVSEVALSFVLLVASALMMKGFLNLRAAPPGFDPSGVIAVGIYAPPWTYPAEERVALYEEVLREIGTIPGVTDVGAVSELPIAGGENEIVFAVEGRVFDNAALPVANGNVITPGYFTTMHIPLLRGRDFTEADRASSPPTTIVSESLAEGYWPGENPVGKLIRLGKLGHRTPSLPEPARWHTVVGVVSDVRHEDLSEQGRMGIYLPLAQENTVAMTMVAKTDGDPLDLAELTRSRIWQVGPGIVVLGVVSMDQVLSLSIWSARIFSAMLGSFAFIALTLAVVGIYGVVAFAVARRSSEIGVRIAMGARKFDIFRLVLGRAGQTLLIGLGLGLLGALAASWVVASIVYEVEALDPAVYATVALALLVAGLIAGFLPARRAIRLDPADTLRCE